MSESTTTIVAEAHEALEAFRGYLAGMGEESRREAIRSTIFEPLSRAVALLHIYDHIGGARTCTCPDDADNCEAHAHLAAPTSKETP